MITVPAEFKTEIEKLRGRRLYARVRIDYSDANIDNTVVATSYDYNPESWIDQVYNGKEDVDKKWIALDGTWVLDGTWALAPDNQVDADINEMGWWSNSLSSYDGNFPNVSGTMYGDSSMYGDSKMYGGTFIYPELSVNFLPRTFSEVRISFDNARLEYAVDFDVVFYDSTLTALYTLSVTGSGGVKYVSSIPTQNSVAQVKIIVKEWSLPGAAAKVAELVTSVSELYTEDDIFNLTISEARELPGQASPTGSTVSGQCSVTLFNRGRKFDYDNEASKLYGLIRKNVRITPEFGDGTNWIKRGVYFAKEWDIAKDSLTVTVSGVDRMALLDETEYSNSQVISAPADQNFSTDSDAEWNAGSSTGITVSGGAIGLST